MFSRKVKDGGSGSRGQSGCRWQVRLSFRPCLPARFKRNSMEVTAFQQENGYKKTSTLANGVPQRGETAFRSAVPCAWSPRVPQALASNYQRFRSCEGSSRGAGDACGCRPMRSLPVNGATCVCTSQGTLCSSGYRCYGANRRARRAHRTAATGQ